MKKSFGRDEALPNFDQPLIAGVDEAGRGPLAGPVIAAAVILPKSLSKGCRRRYFDSKRLTAAARTRLYQAVQKQAVAWAVGRADVEEIDELNIFNANLLAMRRALQALPVKPERVVVDGNSTPKFDAPCYSVIGGDARVELISAASIVAKVVRDKEMLKLHARYPVYNFAAHKGYPTQEHIRNLKRYGPCRAHRKSYRSVRECLSETQRRAAPSNSLPIDRSRIHSAKG